MCLETFSAYGKTWSSRKSETPCFTTFQSNTEVIRITKTKTKSPFGYFGGKHYWTKIICPKIPRHHTYVEPYCGAATIFLSKDPSPVEVINDLDGELINFWRITKHHPKELIKLLSHSLISREHFQQAQNENLKTLTDIQRAARYFYLQRLCYGGRVNSRVFSTSKIRPSGWNQETLPLQFQALFRRLNRTFVENLDAIDCIRRYDSENTFFYLDPPYWGIKGYAHNFKPTDFVRLLNTLKGIRGKFLLSLNDTPEIRRLFGIFKIHEVSSRYFMGNTNKSPETRTPIRTELLIQNFDGI